MRIAGRRDGSDAVLLIAGVHHFKQLGVLHVLHTHKKHSNVREKSTISHTDLPFTTYLCQFLLLLVDPFTFARGKNLLHQFLDSVVVHRVGVDVPAELMKVPSLLTDKENRHKI